MSECRTEERVKAGYSVLYQKYKDLWHPKFVGDDDSLHYGSTTTCVILSSRTSSYF